MNVSSSFIGLSLHFLLSQTGSPVSLFSLFIVPPHSSHFSFINNNYSLNFIKVSPRPGIEPGTVLNVCTAFQADPHTKCGSAARRSFYRLKPTSPTPRTERHVLHTRSHFNSFFLSELITISKIFLNILYRRSHRSIVT